MLVKLILLCLMNLVFGQKNTKSLIGIIPKLGEFPFALCIDGEARCAGVLVTPDMFMTAGHCFNSFNGMDQITIMGVIDLRNKKDPLYQERRIVKYKLYNSFEPDYSTADIAAGYLDKPFTMTETVGVAKIVSRDPEKFKSAWYEVVENREKCRVMGWGRTWVDPINKTEVRSDQLKYIWVLPWPDSNCSELAEISKPMGGVDMCGKGFVTAESVDPTNDTTMPGDSGGPLVCGEYVYGVHTTGDPEFSPVINDFILFYPYLQFFGIGASNQILSNKNTIIISLAIFLNF